MSRPTPERIEEIRSATAGNVLTPRDGWRGVVMELLAEIDALQEELQSAHAVLVDSGDDAQALADRVRELESLARNARDALQRYQEYTSMAPIYSHNEYATLMRSIDAALGPTRRDAP